MNGIQRRKAQNVEKFPGCLGRMVNLFDLSSGVPGNRLLTDKPHRDGSSLSRSQSDVVRMLSPSFGDQIEDKVIVSELKRTSSNTKGNGTPMKTLIAQEMSKEVGSKQNPPNVVAKLMGLETLPRQQPHSAAQRSHSKGSSRHSLSQSGMSFECWEEEQGFPENPMQHDTHHCQELNKCKVVYEIWQQSQKSAFARDSAPQKGRYSRDHSPQKGRYSREGSPQNGRYSRDSSPQNGRCNDNANEKKMALVRQKFMEAKRLATDEKLRQSKEFQDALEVLSSNKDLFLKFLQEPNSLFSQHLSDLQSLHPPSETKRITVLRPAKVVDKNDKFAGMGKRGDKQMNMPSPEIQVSQWDRNALGHSPPFGGQKTDEYPAQPTRIVVLKPSPGKSPDIKNLVSPSLLTPGMLAGEDMFEEPEGDNAQESREVAREITRHMRENMMGHRRDETLLSSVFSNGYIGDDSSFYKSENEFMGGNLSDSEVMSPTSRLSWDYINRFGSPYSTSSFSRASCSPESSVCREAKKRLSERWALMASNGNTQEQRHVRRSSSTLGEMLALSDMRKSARSEEEVCNKEREPRGSTSCIASNSSKEENVDGSPKNLLRSKSVPVSSAYDAGLSVEVFDSEANKTHDPKELTKAKSSKSSFKGKVSSLFFSKNKKSSKEKFSGSQHKGEYPSGILGAPGSPVIHSQSTSSDAPKCANATGSAECLPPIVHGSTHKTSSPDLTMEQKQECAAQELGMSLTKPPSRTSENQDQPSPISVLEPPFEDENIVMESSGNFKLDHQGMELSCKSNLIDKSPPIGSIARTLSWDDSCAETTTSYLAKPSLVSAVTKEDEQDWLSLVQSLLSVASLDKEVQYDSFISGWHSPESPLDPSLREKYSNQHDKEALHESKRRQRRSNWKLVFDCVNEAIIEITGYGAENSVITMSFGRAQRRLLEGRPPLLVDIVCSHIKEWLLSSEVKGLLGDDGDINSLVVERVVRKEVVGRGWGDHMRLEIDSLGKEIERKLLEELVEDAVVDLTVRAV